MKLAAASPATPPPMTTTSKLCSFKYMDFRSPQSLESALPISYSTRLRKLKGYIAVPREDLPLRPGFSNGVDGLLCCSAADLKIRCRLGCRRRRFVQKLQQRLVEKIRRFEVRNVADVWNKHQLRAGNRIGDVLCAGGKVRSVLIATKHQRLDLDVRPIVDDRI